MNKHHLMCNRVSEEKKNAMQIKILLGQVCSFILKHCINTDYFNAVSLTLMPSLIISTCQTNKKF